MKPGKLAGLVMVFLFLLSAYLLWPLLDAILMGLFTSYFFTYLKDNLDIRLNSKKLSGWVIGLSILLVLSGFVYGVSASIATVGKNLDSFVNTVSGSASFVTEVLRLPEPVSFVVASVIQDMSSAARTSIINSFGGLPTFFISFFIYIVTSFYFFFSGERIRNRLFMSLERMEESLASVIRVLARSIYDLFNGVFIKRTVLSLAAFIISSLGFFLMEVEFWQGWAVLVAIVEFIPLMGTFLVYIPMGFLYLALGSYWKGILIIIFGLICIDTITELFIKPRVEIPRIKESSVLITLGIFSGVAIFRLKGIILGPTILIMLRDMLVHIQKSE